MAPGDPVAPCSAADAARRLRERGVTRTLAIVGGGLAGMSVAHHAAAADANVGIAVFDVAEPGEGGASAAAAGLLHPLTTRGGLIWHGVESFQSAAQLVAQTQARSGAQFCFARGVLRVARSEAQATTYRAAAERAIRQHALTVSDGDVEGGELLCWVDAARARELIGADAAPADCAGGVWCARGLCVDAPAYLRALWAATCEAAACALWVVHPVHSLDAACAHFDAVVVAVGAASASVRGLEALPVSLVRGQTLCWPDVPLPLCPRVGVLGGQYLVPLGGDSGRVPAADGRAATGGAARVVGGATFEPLSAGAAPLGSADASTVALAELCEELAQLWPMSAQVAEGSGPPRPHGMGVRAMPPRTRLGSVPLAGRVPGHERNAWFVAGLGGRGLLYHAELGRTVALAALADDDGALLPDCTWPHRAAASY
ncbi:hypothetical protein KFE25_008701 [Diacronema lutheri]|uniref:FAD dependent oxidoreductase domain-containing protein n=2 Tax=Diacronema lutheri TaxID=2081491 RepID=A0A8J5XYJ9_DIALT|nr:hypothetical protein KFE25_008701 [Diacronema lutheri]